jgi:hypothetical protein
MGKEATDMSKRAILGLLLATSALATVSCGGKSEGEDCKASDDCVNGLICQPIKGKGTVCCPAPTESSTEDGCHPSK